MRNATDGTTNNNGRMIGDDFETTKIQHRKYGGGAWVLGALNGHRFEALVFPHHADCPDWEIARSRISKLWVWRIDDSTHVYAWDRGLDLPAANSTAQAIVDFLAEGLATLVFGEEN